MNFSKKNIADLEHSDKKIGVAFGHSIIKISEEYTIHKSGLKLNFSKNNCQFASLEYWNGKIKFWLQSLWAKQEVSIDEFIHLMSKDHSPIMEFFLFNFP